MTAAVTGLARVYPRSGQPCRCGADYGFPAVVQDGLTWTLTWTCVRGHTFTETVTVA